MRTPQRANTMGDSENNHMLRDSLLNNRIIFEYTMTYEKW